MHKEIADKLTEALTSGEYTQAQRSLRTENGFCCLGVLCDLYRKETGDQKEWSVDIDVNGVVTHSFLGETGVLPYEVRNWAGMKSDNGGFDMDHEGYRTLCLSGMNDGGCTFEEIAEAIKENYTEL